MGDKYCLQRPAFVLRPPRDATPLGSAAPYGSHNDLTAFRLPYVLSPPALGLRCSGLVLPCEGSPPPSLKCALN